MPDKGLQENQSIPEAPSTLNLARLLAQVENMTAGRYDELEGRRMGGLVGQFEEAVRHSMRGTPDLTKVDPKQLREVIERLTQLEAMVKYAHEHAEEAAADYRAQMGGVIEAGSSVNLEAAKAAFQSFPAEAAKCKGWEVNGHPQHKVYTIESTKEAILDDEDEERYGDLDGTDILTARIDHIDEDREYEEDDEPDYCGAYTTLVVKMNSDGKISYEFLGDELDEDYQAQLIEVINGIAGTI